MRLKKNIPTVLFCFFAAGCFAQPVSPAERKVGSFLLT